MKKIDKIKLAAAIVFALYAALLFYQIFIGPYRTHFTRFTFNIHPFETIIKFSKKCTDADLRPFLINIVSNIVIFIPAGFLLPVLFRKMKNFIFLSGFSVAALFVIELTQMLLKIGVFDIDDIILNTFGIAIGYFSYKIASIWYFNNPKRT